MILQDLRYALRALRTSPSFTLVAILLLALGIGANSAIFSLVSTFLLRPYPYQEADRLVTVHTSSDKYGVGYGQFSVPDYVDLRAQEVGLADTALWRMRSYNVARDDSSVRLAGAHVTANFFDVLGAEMLLGRGFAPGEDAPGNAVVVLSEGAWRNEFGAQQELLGGEILLDGEPHTVVGVLRGGSEHPESRKLWKAHLDDVEGEPRYRRVNWVIGRQAAGSTLPSIREQLAAFSSRLATTYPDSNGAYSMTAQSLRDYRVGDSVPLLRLLMGVVSMVLLIVCANLANLQLARTTRRHHELAVRVALGAGRVRIVRQLLLEGLVVSLAGAGLGMLVGQYSVTALLGARPVPLPASYAVSIDWRVFLFVLVTTVASALLFGLLPALRASRPDLLETLNASARTGAANRGRLLGSLVVAEVALSTILLIGAVLALRSFLNVLEVTPGFEPDATVTLSVQPAAASYSVWESVAFVRSLERVVAELPGVRRVGSAAVLPLIGTAYTAVQADNQSELEAKDNPSMHFYPVTPGFFDAMQIPLLAGRAFGDADDRESEAVVIVSAGTAARFWPEEPAVGKQLRQNDSRWMRVVGVVGDIRQRGLDQGVDLQMYLPHAQEPWRGMALVIRADGDASQQIAAVREEIRRLDPTIAPYNVISMADALEMSTFDRRFLALLVWIFGALSLLLAAIGLYGVIAYSASQRTREIGLRLALGAAPGDVLRLIATQGTGLTLLGLTLGIAGALLLSRTISGQLFEVSATDPVVYAGVAITLGSVAFIAAVVPGQRAARLDPAIALRDE